jgi:hypothetical protein
MTNKDISWWRVYALVLLQIFRQVSLKQEETTKYVDNSLPISRDNMKTPFYQEYSITFAKRQESRDNALAFLPIDNKQHPQSIKRDIERFSQVGKKIQPR